MKPPRRRFIYLIVLAAVFLLGSIALNYFLFQQGQWYYLQLNMERLDPLGLSYYPTTPDQRDSTNLNRTTVVFFGDSRAESWPAPDLPQFEFVHRGIGSQTSQQALLRFDYHIKPLQPRIIVVQIGINDLKTIPLFPKRKDAIIANCKENIRQIVVRSTDLGAKVILTTIFPIGEVPIERRPFWSDDVAPAIEQVNAYIRSMKEEKVIVFDAYSVLVGKNGTSVPSYSQDLLHLNAAGYERLNQEFARVLMAMD